MADIRSSLFTYLKVDECVLESSQPMLTNASLSTGLNVSCHIPALSLPWAVCFRMPDYIQKSNGARHNFQVVCGANILIKDLRLTATFHFVFYYTALQLWRVLRSDAVKQLIFVNYWASTILTRHGAGVERGLLTNFA